MEIILQELENKKCWKSFLKTQCRRNSIDPAFANHFTIVKFRKFIQKSLQNLSLQYSKQTNDKPRKKSSVWLQNELKAYQWFLIALSGCRGLPIENFTNAEWQELSNIFGKQQTVLQYEAIKLINEKKNLKRKWQGEESDILQSIIKQDPTSNKWNQIARKLFDLSEKKYFRSGKQCREHWLNHLDPNKMHGQWQSTEDRFIAQYILKFGKKWSEIARLLQNKRTEHMVKNRYKTIIIRMRKAHQTLKSENQMLRTLLRQQTQSAAKKSFQSKREDDKRLQLQGLPVVESEKQDENGQFQFQIKNADMIDRINSSVRQFEFHQVVTPCPMIYQSFTPTFLNTPHALPFLSNFSFGKFDKNDNLFLKNN